MGLLSNDELAKLQPAETKAAMFFGYCNAQPALVRDALPERNVVRLGGIVEHVAHGLAARLLGEEFTRLVAQHLLVVGEIEIHGAALPRSIFLSP